MAYEDQFNINFTPTTSPVGEQADIYAGIDKGYSDAIAGQSTVPQLTTKYNEMFGVPQMQQQLQQGTELFDTLGAQMRGLPKDIAQRSQESIVTQGQKNRMIQAEQAPILEQQGILGTNLSRLQSNLGTAQQNAGMMISAEQAQQAKELSPWLQKYDNQSVLSAMRMSGWTLENQMELDRLLANQQAGVTLSEGERNRANQLSIAEKGFAAQLEQIREQGNQARLTKKALPDLGTLYSSMFG